jgi:hypothetical protein
MRISHLKDKESNYKYWQSKTVLERLAAVESLRLQYIEFKNNVDSRLQRICSVISKN